MWKTPKITNVTVELNIENWQGLSHERCRQKWEDELNLEHISIDLKANILGHNEKLEKKGMNTELSKYSEWADYFFYVTLNLC